MSKFSIQGFFNHATVFKGTHFFSKFTVFHFITFLEFKEKFVEFFLQVLQPILLSADRVSITAFVKLNALAND